MSNPSVTITDESLGQRVHPDQGLHVRIVGLLSVLACADSPSAKIPDDAVSTLQSNDKITVEADGEVKTQ
jgi:hypothetical protein